MNKYRIKRKPLILEAYQTDKDIYIDSLEGRMKAEKGDWIITGIKGEKYPCKADVFHQIYEILDED